MTQLIWPDLPYAAWKDTYETLHMWTQIVGKIRLAQMPWLNHTWQVTLYPTATGLTMPNLRRGAGASCARRLKCSAVFDRATTAKRARFISSGAASISP